MSVGCFERVFDIALSHEKTNKPEVRLLEPGDALLGQEKALRCVVGLLGEKEPEVLPVSPSYAVDTDQRVYRYDWVFGISVPLEREPYWNWQGPLREKSAAVVQLLIAPGKSGFGFTDISTALLGLHPSKDTRSWLESHSEQLGKSLLAAANLATETGGLGGPTGSAVGGAVSAVLRASSVISNFVSSGEAQAKNWYMYRFLDAEERCCAVEWKINKRVLLEYGPLLRGSILLAFHGAAAGTGGQEGIKMILRPNLGYYEDDELCHVRPTLKLPSDQRPELLVKPRAAVNVRSGG